MAKLYQNNDFNTRFPETKTKGRNSGRRPTFKVGDVKNIVEEFALMVRADQIEKCSVGGASIIGASIRGVTDQVDNDYRLLSNCVPKTRVSIYPYSHTNK